MYTGAPVVTTSLNGETMRGRYLAHSRTEEVVQPNRTDIQNGIPADQARQFRATRNFITILFLHNGRLFQQERNAAFVYPDFRVEMGQPIEGLDVLEGKPLGIGQLIEKAMADQRAASGGVDGTAVEVPVVADAKAAKA